MREIEKKMIKVADAIADEVVDEYNEASDGNLQKAISYVILDKLDNKPLFLER